jgi:hypothetical protein
MTVGISLSSETHGCGFHGKYLLVSKCAVCEAVARRLSAAGVTAREWYQGTKWEQP